MLDICFLEHRNDVGEITPDAMKELMSYVRNGTKLSLNVFLAAMQVTGQARTMLLVT